MASDSSHGKVTIFVELLFNDSQFADVEERDGTLIVNLYPKQDNQPWTIPYSDFVNALEVAKEKLKIK